MKWRFQLGFLLVVLLGALLLYWTWDGWLEHSQDTVIRAAAARYGVDAALVKAIVWRESRFNPTAKGRAEEFGLMQLQEEAAREWADAEHIAGFDHRLCFDPATNTLAGTWYLRKLLRRYRNTDNPLPYALADYNAGRGNVLKWARGEAATNSAVFLETIGFPGTRLYVKEVSRRYAHYRPLFRKYDTALAPVAESAKPPPRNALPSAPLLPVTSSPPLSAPLSNSPNAEAATGGVPTGVFDKGSNKGREQDPATQGATTNRVDPQNRGEPESRSPQFL